jgi:hypothetical protein
MTRSDARECGAVLFSGPVRVVEPIYPVIYGLCDPREPRRIRYVGRTVRPRSRYEAHCGLSSGGTIITQWLAGLIGAGIWPVMLLIWEASSGDELWGAEARWISRLKRRGMADLNVATVPHVRRIRSSQGVTA